MKHRKPQMHGLFAALALATLAASPLRAQTSGTTPALEEVIVTAERRGAENIQQVPMSLSALSGSTLENMGMTTFDDYARSMPNLAIGVGGGAGGNGSGFGISTSRSVTIRGVAGNNTTSYYINDTPVPLSLDPRVIDIDRVEVLRGPQGTLFGASSMGGTIRLITTSPGLDHTSGKIDAETFTNTGGVGYSLEGTLNTPLVDNQVGLRTSAFSAWTPGWFDRVWGVSTAPGVALPPGAPSGEKKNVAGKQETGVVASMAIVPAAVQGLTVTPIFMYEKYTQNGYPTADYTPDNLVQNRPLDVPEAVEDTWTFAGLTARYDAPFGHFVGSGTYFWRNGFDLEDGTDFAAGVYPGFPYYVAAPLYNNLYTKTWSGELRYESTLSGPLQFVVGAYMELQERTYVENWPAPGADAASGGALGTDILWTENAPNADRQRAMFVDATYSVTSALQVSAGVRRAYLSHSFTYDIGGYEAGGAPTVSGEHGEWNTSPRFTAKYQLTPEDMLYATAAKGFRIGGQNFQLPAVCDASLAAVGLTNGSPFTSDSLWNYELGTKNSWFGGRVKSRFDVYRIDWSNIQQTLVLACSFDVTTNSGAARSDGAELEIDAYPVDHLTLNIAVGYEDAKITEVKPGSVTVLGQPLNGVPRWTGSAIAQYTIPWGDKSPYLRAQVTSVSSSTSYNNVPYPGREVTGFSLLNLRAGIEKGPWNAALYLDNALDKRGNMGDITPEVGELPGRPRWKITPPRTFGLFLQRTF